MDNITIKTIDSVSDMIAQYELICQLSPNVTRDDYMLLVNEMVTLNYRQAVAYINEKPVGVCGFWINTKIYSGKYVELDNVVVDNNFRNKNIGQLLCDYVLEIAKQNNCKTAMLDAYLENERAHVFYERIGFKKKGFHFIKPL